MTETYSVNWAGAAERDLREIILYIARDSPANAMNIFHKIKGTAEGLYTFAQRGRIVPELHAHGIFTYREMIVPPWRIIYRICAREVSVLSVLDARRNVEDILLQRLADPFS